SEHLEVAGIVDPADIGGQNPFRRDEFDVRTGPGQYLCGVQAWMLTVVVVEQHVAPDPERSTQYVPAVGYEMSAFGEEFGVRDASGGDDDQVRFLGEHVVGLGVGIEPDIDVVVFAFGQPPVDDADQIPPTWRRRGEPDLAARSVVRLQHNHPMPALAEHSGRLEPRG